mmetsp:Transcript_7575/g.18278  ORF Transcript_7575/g.18278 Transcript_7575/m.18278 type:complete len:467 (+) Transcript_7575:148-1548(+)
MPKKAKVAMLSAYPLADQPIGSSVPYMPQARPWNVRSVNAPTMGEGRDPSSRVEEFVGAGGDAQKEEDAKGKEKASQKAAAAAGMARPTASVTEIPGASRAAKRLFQDADVRKAGLPIKGATLLKELVAEVSTSHEQKAPVQHLTFPAILYFFLGLVFPPLLLCGCRYTSSANATAKLFGFASLFMLGAYTTIGLIVFAMLWKDDAWNKSDPACTQYIIDTDNRMTTVYGKATSIDSLDAPGLQTTQNVSLYQVDCAYVMQVVVDDASLTKIPRTMVVKVSTPGTTGDNFGVYARALGAKVNPSQGQVPAKSWFTYSNPFESNPWPESSVYYDKETPVRPPCKMGMCDGVYGNGLPLISGSQWEVRAPLGWYKYYMGIGVFALDTFATERAFCIDTCVYNHELIPDSDPPQYKDPCAEYPDEITSCPNKQVAACTFARTRNDCLGQITLRGKKGSKELEQDPAFFS